MNSKCIVTLTIGNKFEHQWQNFCYQNWKNYADKHGYDLININSPLDLSERAKNRSPAWQKCLIFSLPELAKYRQIVWIDADILINTALAPCICSFVSEEKIGGVEENSYPHKQIYSKILQKKYELWRKKGIKYIDNLSAELYYKNYGIETEINKIFQTGVVVASPKYHADIFRKTYDTYEDKGGASWNYEMRPLSYEIISSNTVEWLPNEFNLCVSTYLNTHYQFLMNSKINNKYLRKISNLLNFPDYPYEINCIQSAFNNSFFCHFTGMGFSKMKYIIS